MVVYMESTHSTTDEILKTAFRLFLHYGFKKTTIDDIASEAGIAKGSVYLHFNSKKEILCEVIRKFAKENLEKITEKLDRIPLAEERLRFLLLQRTEHVCTVVKNHHHGDEIIHPEDLPEGPPQEVLDVFRDVLKGVLEYGVERAEFRKMNSADMAEHIVFMTRRFLPPYSDGFCETAMKKHCNQYVDSIVQGMRNTHPEEK